MPEGMCGMAMVAEKWPSYIRKVAFCKMRRQKFWRALHSLSTVSEGVARSRWRVAFWGTSGLFF